MKNSFLLCLISIFYLNSNGICGKTDLLIRAQDDETEGGLKLKISIPQTIRTGPVGDDIEVISDNGKKAIRDSKGTFIKYDYVDKEGNIASQLSVKKLFGINGEWPPTKALISMTDPEGKREEISLEIKQDNKKIFFVEYGEFTYNIPSYINSWNFHYPFVLEPRDSEGNILSSKSVDQMPFFDDVSTFGTVWTVFDMYGRDIEALNDKETQLKWVKRGKVRIFPHMTEEQFKKLYPYDTYQKYEKNAFYDYRPQDINGEHVLCFFPVVFGTSKYTSQSFDVVSHETGHNVLNILRPDLWGSTSSDIIAFHETFGDITALFSVLKFPELRERILTKTKGNLHVPSFLSVIGEKIVDRDATDYTKISVLPSCEEHELSERLTRALYGTFADFFNTTRKDNSYGIDSLLEKTADTFRLTFLRATLNSKLTSFIDFGRTLRSEANPLPLLEHLVHINFLRQGIDLTDQLLPIQVCSLETGEEDQSKALGCSTGRVIKKKSFMSPFNSYSLTSEFFNNSSTEYYQN